jgi:hypothetical protein
MIEVTILIPLADNSGLTFSPAHVGVFETKLLDAFRGFSRLPAHVVGAWVDRETEYRDILFAYVVAVDGLIAQGQRLREVVDFARVHFRQEAIFCRYLGVAEVL